MVRRILATAVGAMLLVFGAVSAQEQEPQYPSGMESSMKLVSGTVVSINENECVIRTEAGDEMTFNLNTQTDKPVSLRVGDRVRVHYDDGWTSDTATQIIALSGPEAGAPSAQDERYGSDTSSEMREPASDVSAKRSYGVTSGAAAGSVSGTIISISQDRLVVRTDDGQRKTFVLDQGQHAGHLNLKAGDMVRVEFDDRAGQRVASNVVLSDEAGTAVAQGQADRLPQTASPLPLFALGGLLSLGAAAIVRRFRRK